MQPTAFDPTRYPRTYTASAGWRAFALLLGGGVGVGGLAGIAYFGSGHEWRGAGAARTMCGVSLALALLGVVTLLGILRARVVLAPSFIESRSLRTRRLPRADIVDYRVHMHDGIGEFRIRRTSSRRLFKFTLVFKVDAEFTAWFAGLKNTDQIAHEAALREIERDDTLGATPSARLDSARRARRMAAWLGGLGMAITAWTCIYPHPYWLAVSSAAILPLVAIYLCWQFSGLFSIAGKKQSARGELAAVLIGPGMVIALRATLDTTLVNPTVLVVPSLLAGAALAGLAVAACVDLRKQPGYALMTAPFLIFYAAGGLALANGLLDRSPGSRSPASIVAKRHTTGKGATAYFTLTGLSRDLDSEEVKVSFDLYRRSAVGDRVCFIDHSGAFGWHWTGVDVEAACPSS